MRLSRKALPRGCPADFDLGAAPASRGWVGAGTGVQVPTCFALSKFIPASDTTLLALVSILADKPPAPTNAP